MPGPAILAGPGAIAAAKHLAFQVATSVDATTVGSAALAVFLLYWCFHKLPDWIKKDISFRNLLRNRQEISKEEITGLVSVLEKIQHMMESIQEMDHAHTEIPQLHAALLAFIQVSGQLKLEQIKAVNRVESTRKRKITMRDSVYQSSGRTVPISKLRSDENQTALTLSTWAYYEDSMILTEKLLDMGYTLLRHHLVAQPGTVAHYIAVSPSQRQVVVGMRGTSSLEDIMTDCCGRAVALIDDENMGDKVRVEVKAAVPIQVLAQAGSDIIEIVSGHERIVFEDHDEDGDNYIRCHEGILHSARHVMVEIGPFLRDYLMECQYRVVFCGHSLGAGTAVVAATLLRSRYPQLFLNDDHHRRIHVYAFAPPPVLDYDSAIAASSFCTTFVYNADLVSRLNISNLVVALACLQKVQCKLIEEDLNPTNPVTTMKFFNKLREGLQGRPLISLSEFHDTISNTHADLALRRPEHLFLPGRVLLIYNPWIGDNEDDDDDSSSSTINCTQKLGPSDWKCVETVGTSSVFQSLEIDGLRCFTDHLTSSYFEAMGMDYQF
ncbi:lipase class 3 [Nitzschia inconspicua]|uniref:Lipase class 3 n=1 Tax=Nitzschia inconspicua TaxID=303405 RepID=A0A9K3PWR0_9STRA|nr:lipase class 3 [Nitzschia inconspicua]